MKSLDLLTKSEPSALGVCLSLEPIHAFQDREGMLGHLFPRPFGVLHILERKDPQHLDAQGVMGWSV